MLKVIFCFRWSINSNLLCFWFKFKVKFIPQNISCAFWVSKCLFFLRNRFPFSLPPTYTLGCCSCLDLFRFFSTFFKIGGCQKNQEYKVWEKKLRLRDRAETFFTQELVFVLFCTARWCYVKSLLLMSHCKIEHSLLVLYIQENFNTNSKTVYIYLFIYFFQN